MSSAPPFRLPGTHFIGALGWLLLGGAGLVVVAPHLAAARFLEPRVLAVTHMYTIGVIAASIFGALYQFYPMSLGAGARSVPVGVAGGWLLHSGTVLLVAGLWWWVPLLQASGWIAVVLAVGCLSWNLLPHRRRMTQGRRTAGYVSAAHAMLGFALLLAGARIGEHIGWWTVDRLGAIGAHFHLAAFGFAGLTAVGVGGRMLPMFFVSGPGPEWPMRAIGPLGFVGLLLLAGGLLFALPAAVAGGAAMSVAAGALFVWMVSGYVRRRLVRRLEPAFGHVIAGFAALVLAVAAGVAQLALPGFSARGWVVYAELTLLGWLVVFITGVMYRLLGFLIWLHFYSRLGPARVSAELVNRRTAWLALWLMLSGVVLLVAGSWTGALAAVRSGALLILGGSALTAVQYLLMFTGRPDAAPPPP